MSRRLGQLVMSAELLAGMLGLKGKVVEVSQTDGDRRLGAIRVTVESELLDPVTPAQMVPIVDLEDVQ